MKEIIKRILKEDINKKYLDKIVDHMIKHFNYKNKHVLMNHLNEFIDYCITNFGLTDLELNYVYHKYRFLMGWEEKDLSDAYL